MATIRKNPLEIAPPPGSNEAAASAAQTARLHQRITDLERRVTSAESPFPGVWTPLTISYLNGWTAYGGNYGPYYRIDAMGFVHFSGLIKVGSAVTVGTLPAGVRPITGGGTEEYFSFPGYTGAAYTIALGYVYPSGNFVINATIAAGAWYSMAHVSWPTK